MDLVPLGGAGELIDFEIYRRLSGEVAQRTI